MMIRTATRRLATLTRQLTSDNYAQTTHEEGALGPSIFVSNEECMYDEPVQIRVHGLRPKQTITLVAKILDVPKFQSHAVFDARNDGTVDLTRDAPNSGTYTGVHPMGLFWSMILSPEETYGGRLITKNASIPRDILLELFPTEIDPFLEQNVKPIKEKTIRRLYMKPGVKRIVVKENGLRGTLFVPEGSGPFPAIIDMFGGLVSLVESRAALLASRGYATFALAYMMVDDLPKNFIDINLKYFLNAAEWFSKQPFVDEDRLGAFGLCFGGTLALNLATECPMIKCVVNVNGGEYSIKDMKTAWSHRYGDKAPIGQLFTTAEGMVMRDIVQVQKGDFLPVWEHNVKVFTVISGDDMMVDHTMHFRFREEYPESVKDNIKTQFYPAAGHLVEPPYSPLYRTIYKKLKKEKGEQFPHYMSDQPLVAGGRPEEHAFAQEDGWKKSLQFLDQNL